MDLKFECIVCEGHFPWGTGHECEFQPEGTEEWRTGWLCPECYDLELEWVEEFDG